MRSDYGKVCEIEMQGLLLRNEAMKNWIEEILIMPVWSEGEANVSE